MTKAEKRALEAYPIDIQEYSDSCAEYDSNKSDRLTFIEGYEQAEKDIILKIKSRIAEVVGDAQPNPTIRIELFGIIDSIRNELDTEL